MANIPDRIGTSHRWYHWLTCNHLVDLGRRNSHLHETELNLALIAKQFGVENPTLSEIPSLYGLTPKLTTFQDIPISKTKFNLLFHPRSKGSAREIPLETIRAVIENLDASVYQLFIGGTSEDGQLLSHWIKTLPKTVVNVCGRFSLGEYIDFIAAIDGIVSGSTGPLHIASALGRFALGLYPPLQPMHPGRWRPIGDNASFITGKDKCHTCKPENNTCECMKIIPPETIIRMINQFSSASKN